MNAALLPLIAVVPLLAAGLCVVIRRATVERVLMLSIPLATTLAGAALLPVHADTPVVAHHVGGFVPGVAIPFVSDTLTAVLLVVTGLTTAVSAAFLIRTGEDRYRFVPPLALMLTGGVNGALLTGDLFNLFVFVEVMLLPSYALIAVTGTWRRLGIGRLFILVNLLTSTLLLLGVAFVYGVTGTVTLAALAGAAAHDGRASLAVGVVLLALSIKGGLVPVHSWLPRAYPATSAGVMALFSGLHTKVALYAIYRIYATTYGAAPAPWVAVLASVAVVTMLVGAVATLGERRMRPALAWQMVSGVGHIMLGLVVFTTASLAAGVFYLAHHVITMGALLLTVGAIEHVYGTGRFDRLNGLMRREPGVAIVAVLGLFSLIGFPPMSGVWGKVSLMMAAAGAGGARGSLGTWTPAAYVGAIVLASLATVVALQRLWVDVFWGPPMTTYRPDDLRTGRGRPTPVTGEVRVDGRLLAPAAVLTAASVGMFLGAGVLMPIAQRAAAGLVDLHPYVVGVLGR